MKKYGDLKLFIINLLKDEKEHSIEELAELIVSNGIRATISNAHISTAISQLIGNGEKILRVKSGVYRMEETKEKKLGPGGGIDVSNVLMECIKLENELIEKLTYDLSAEQYANYQKMYKENRKYILNIRNMVE